MYQNHQGCEKQAPAVKILNKKHRRKHHEMSPIINAAIDTALIFHKSHLERAKKQDANVIA